MVNNYFTSWASRTNLAYSARPTKQTGVLINVQMHIKIFSEVFVTEIMQNGDRKLRQVVLSSDPNIIVCLKPNLRKGESEMKWWIPLTHVNVDMAEVKEEISIKYKNEMNNLDGKVVELNAKICQLGAFYFWSPRMGHPVHSKCSYPILRPKKGQETKAKAARRTRKDSFIATQVKPKSPASHSRCSAGRSYAPLYAL